MSTKQLWRVCSSNDDYSEYWIEQVGFGGAIRCEDETGDGVNNSRLIAISPELADALRALANKAKSIAMKHCEGTDTPQDWSALWNITNEARAVLEKLEG